MKNINMFDFTLNFYLTTGVKIELAPCFGLNQQIWEKDPNLGFWFRITFAKKMSQLSTGIKKLIAFKNIYLSNPNKFIQTGLSF